jgi:hypothetical protein
MLGAGSSLLGAFVGRSERALALMAVLFQVDVLLAATLAHNSTLRYGTSWVAGLACPGSAGAKAGHRTSLPVAVEDRTSMVVA